MKIMDKLDHLRGKFFTAVELARREFWDKYQEKGKRTDYEYAFTGWDNKCFYPYHELGNEDYPIEVANRMFYNSFFSNAGRIVLCDECEVIGMFAYSRVAYAHITILGALTDCEDMFFSAARLESLTFEGTIYADLNIQWSGSLTEESLRSVVNALQDLYAEGEEFEYTIYFSSDSMAILQSTGLLNDIYRKGWNV